MKKLYAIFFLLMIAFQLSAHEINPILTPNCATISLTSGTGSDAQTICINTPISPITFAVANGGTGATATGLPSGVSMAYNAATGEAFISGTPTSAGTFSFQVSTTGGNCPDAPDIWSGTITVNPNATLTLASTVSSANQTVCVNTPILTIVYIAGNGATGATVLDLPTGVTGIFNPVTQAMTISGAPTVAGVFNYVVTTIGGCSSATLSGTIVVNPDASVALTSPAGTDSQTLCVGMPIVPINYTIGNGATSGIVIGLPPGVASSFSGNVFTFTGNPTASGTYAYSVTTTGGCGVTVINGSITVSDNAPLNLICDWGMPNTVGFDWTPILGATAYNYSYTIDSGPIITGTVVGLSNFAVPVTSSDQSVAFTITSVNGSVPCFEPQTLTCDSLANEQFDSHAFAYFPVPVTDVLHLEYEQNLIDVSIYNSTGQKVLYSTIDSSKATIDMSRLPSGIYIAKITTASSSKTIRLIKQ